MIPKTFVRVFGISAGQVMKIKPTIIKSEMIPKTFVRVFGISAGQVMKIKPTIIVGFIFRTWPALIQLL